MLIAGFFIKPALFAQNNDTVIQRVYQDDALTSDLIYSSQDSLSLLISENKMALYGNAHINYEGMDIVADYIEIDMNSNEVYASGLPDSNGVMQGYPVFKDKGTTYNVHQLRYNMNTKQATIKSFRTQEDDGYITGETIKLQKNEHIHIKKGTYTTCSLEHPHYAFNLSKMIVIPDDKIISQAGYLSISGVPTPLVVPFGLFPNSKKSKAGILMPAPGVSEQQGFFLQNLGFYTPINDYMSFKIYADIYSRGSFKVNPIFDYKVRYKYSGGVNFSYGKNIFGQQAFNNQSVTTNMFIRWNHTQDSKANPNIRFSANVNFGSTQEFRQDLNSNSNDYLNNSFSSNIQFYQKINNSPFSYNVNLRHNQNSNTGFMEFILPEFTLNMARINPLKFLRKKETIGEAKWFENVGLTYSMSVKNRWQTTDTIFNNDEAIRKAYIEKSLEEDLSFGVSQRAALNSSVKMFNKKVTFNPSMNFANVTTTKFVEQSTIISSSGLQDSVVYDYQPQIDNFFNWDAAGSFTTKIQGMYTLNKGKGFIQKFRHVLTPNVGLLFSPEYDRSSAYLVQDTTDDGSAYYYDQNYNPYQKSVYQPVNSGMRANITFGMVNSLELKVRDKKDTIKGSKVVKIIENLSINSSYNLAADSLNFNDINISANTKLFDKVNVRYTGAFTPYELERGRKVNNYKVNSITNEGLLTHLRSNMNVSFPILNSNKPEDKRRPYYLPSTMNIGYTIDFKNGYSTLTESDTVIITQSATLNGRLTLTDNWGISYRTGYDFQNDEFTYTEFTFTRDLHCWLLSFNWIPFGDRAQYRFTLQIKASSLKDLKVERKKPWYDQ